MRVRTAVGARTSRVPTVATTVLGGLLGLLALLLPLLAVPAPSAANDAGAGGAGGPRAAYRLEVVTANLDGAERSRGGDKLGTVQRVVRGSAPDVVLLQEVCWKHFRRFIEANRSWIGAGESWRDHFAFQKLRYHSGCASGKGVQRHGLVIASRHRLSEVVSHRLPNPHSRTPHRFRVMCADVAVRGPLLAYAPDAVRACTTQLRAGRGRASGAGPARQAQAVAVRRVLAPIIERDRAAVVLGGDFNAVPQKGTMSQLYRLSRHGFLTNQRGLFFEADQTGAYASTPTGRAAGLEQIVCRLTPRVCRWGDPTHRSRGQARKLDYVFFGVNRAEPAATSGLFGTRHHLGGDVVRSPSATHEVYLGWADLQLDLS
ncbi:endonuclease/exonuclease/phosphatase family protein [Nocardioides abyssi]|uniref:Endonuclease/exonuclease/phosphatase family protein n=1 Tax=Nocardioides abyssi TaxID=3058370 RepID=A0ABT8ETH1_9ACTN|nr:endonuclease/exonuclease/phosphatase family protein [Nocardioides abyssi]MDN4161402.1 endonuclease/exonuclease/phosphatase family protein [Nocardioides abyssi]